VEILKSLKGRKRIEAHGSSDYRPKNTKTTVFIAGSLSISEHLRAVEY